MVVSQVGEGRSCERRSAQALDRQVVNDRKGQEWYKNDMDEPRVSQGLELEQRSSEGGFPRSLGEEVDVGFVN